MTDDQRIARQAFALVLIEREAIIEALNALCRGDAERAEERLRAREESWTCKST
jgi:hypothetical protein